MLINFTWLKNISRRKPMNEDDAGKSKLKRCLTTTDLTVLGVGGTVGAGLYVLTGVVAKNTTGPAIIISYLIAGFVSLLSAVCYAEFACRIPKTGSAYTYIYVSIGELWAFLIGWNLMLEYIVSAASVATAWSGYFDHMIGDRIQNFTIEYVLGGEPWDTPFIAECPDIFGAFVLYAVVIIVSFGASTSAGATAVMLFVNVLVVLFVFIVGLIYADVTNWNVDGGGFAPYGAEGIISGSATLFYAYVGFDVIAIAGEETINQSKSVPRATYLTLGISTTMYLAVSIALTLLVPYSTIDENSAFASAFAAHGLQWAQYIVSVGALCAMFTALLGSVFCLPRSVYAMAIDGILFKFMSKVNERTQVPVRATLVFGTVAAIMTVIFDIEALVEFLSIGVLMAYTIVSGALIRVRYSPIGEELYQFDSINEDMDRNKTSKLEENSKTESLYKIAIPGTLKDKYHTRFSFLSQYAAGYVVCVCLMLSTSLQFVTILIAKVALEQLKEGAWWAWIIVIICASLAVVAFIPIPLHHQIEIKSGFKVPFSPWIPALSILCNIFLMLQLAPVTWIRFVIWVAIGLFIYAVYGYHHSVTGQLNQTDEKGVKFRVLQNDDDSSSQKFTKALYGTIKRQQPHNKYNRMYEEDDDQTHTTADFAGNGNKAD